MKPKKADRNLREIFRHTLENAEVTPDPAVSLKLMRKLAVREFLHFSPARFNVYYLGGIIAAAIVTVLLISPAKEGNEMIQPGNSVRQTLSVASGERLMIPAGQNTSGKKLSDSIKITPPAGKESNTGKQPVVLNPAVRKSVSIDTYNLSTDTLKRSLEGTSLFPGVTEEKLKLQEMKRSEEELFKSSVTKGCAPLRVIFKSNIPEYDSCFWTFGDGGSSSGRNPEWIYDVEGDYKVVLKVIGPDGIVTSSSSAISVFPGPSASFEIYPDNIAIPEDEVHFQNYSSGAVRYLWHFGDGSTSELFEPVHRYEKSGNYDISLKVFSENGCADSLVVYNAFSGSSYFIEFPNAFIPNEGGPSGGLYSPKSDETAQVFHPSFYGVSEYHLKIFSKLGVLIFETNDINVGWDGYYKGQLSNSGVYIWKVRGNFTNGEPFTKMGDVTLLKN